MASKRAEAISRPLTAAAQDALGSTAARTRDPGRDMRDNVKRGLLRLWLVGTVFWLIGAGVWLRPDRTVAHLWSGPSMAELAFYGTGCSVEMGCPPSVPPRWTRPWYEQHHLSASERQSIGEANALESENDFLEEEKANPSWQAADRAQIRRADLWRLANDAGIGFGPSVAAAMLGAALLWAIRGFRTEP